jgi:hypothetical protein
MIAADTLEVLGIVASALGELCDEAMFVGGAIAGALVTNSAPPRETDDVDLVVDIATYADHVQLTERLRALGFAEDSSEGAPTCRWIIEGIKVDVMSTGPIPGPTNRWYADAMANTQVFDLNSQLAIRIMSAPYFVADKLDTFGDGRRGDYISSHDLEDFIAVIDGRDTIEAEVLAAPSSVREFLARKVQSLLADRRFIDAVAGHLRGDSASQARLPLVLARMRAIAGAA